MNTDFIHEISITEITKDLVNNNFNDVIIHCRWSLKTYHKDHLDVIEYFSGATPFKINDSDLENSFIPFEDLTEEIVVSWVKSHAPNLIMIKKQNQKNIEKRIFAETRSIISNPWKPELEIPLESVNSRPESDEILKIAEEELSNE